MTRELLWVSLPDQRPRREVYWMSQMPDTRVTAIAADQPDGDLNWVPGHYRRPVKRFIEAGAFAWLRNLDELRPDRFDWVVSLELCSLVTGQAARWRDQASRRPRQAVITWENLPNQPLYRLWPYSRSVRASRRADLLLCMVDAARDHLLELGFDEQRIRVVKPGVDTDVFKPAAAPAMSPRVVFVSPLEPNKGLDQILKAWPLVEREVDGAELLIAGRGSLRKLAEDAAEAGHRVRLTGNLDAVGVADLLRSAQVFVTAPRPTWKWEEQFGLAYVEAQACALPVVTTRCGSNIEALRSPRDSFVDDDPEAIAEGIVRRLKDPLGARAEGLANADWALREHSLQVQTQRMGAAFSEFDEC